MKCRVCALLDVYEKTKTLGNKQQHFRIPGHFNYMCRRALKNEVSIIVAILIQ